MPHSASRRPITVALVWLALAGTTLATRPAPAGDTDAPYHKLTWDDFMGPAPTGEDEDAELNSGDDYSWLVDHDHVELVGETWKARLKDVKVRAYMDKTQSGVKPDSKTDALLRHEQHHFDISEYCAREHEKALQGVVGTGTSRQAALDDAKAKAEAIDKEVADKHDKMQKAYDDETDHGSDQEKQAEWCEKIGDLLNPPKPEESTSSSNTGQSSYDPNTRQSSTDGIRLSSFSDLGAPVYDPYLNQAQVVLPPLFYGGNNVGLVHPLLFATEESAGFQVVTVGARVALEGRLRLLFGDDPDSTLSGWIEEITIDPVALEQSPFLQLVEASRKTGQTIVTVTLRPATPLSQATAQWTLPAVVALQADLGTSYCDPAAPVILVQPRSQVVAAGAPVRLSVFVPGAGPFTYAWRKNGVPLPDGGSWSGTRTDSLRIAAFGPEAVGSYDALVTSPCGQTLSASATLNFADIDLPALPRTLWPVLLAALAGAGLLRLRARPRAAAGQGRT